MPRNLKAEMVRYSVTAMNVAEAIGKSDRAVRDKLDDKTPFDVNEAFTVRDRFFPGMTLEYLFSRVPSETI